MFELFLALFGGAAYMAKLSSEKAKVRAYNDASRDRTAWHQARVDGWNRRVVDRSVQADLSHLIESPGSYDAVCDEVYEAYKYIYGPEAFPRLLLSEQMVADAFGKSRFTKKQRENIAASHRSDALDIMLANRGKVRGPQICSMDRIRVLPFAPGEQDRKLWDESFRFVKYLRDALREHGVPDARPVFMTGLFEREGKSTPYDIEDVVRYRYTAGGFVWHPVTYYDDDLHYVSVP